MQKKIIRRELLVDDTNHFSIHPLLQRIYRSRGVKCETELQHPLDSLLSFDALKDIKKAVSILFEALQSQKQILIVGDFDADGATSTAVAMRALRSFGAQKVNYLVPNRFAFGYGLTPELVDAAQQFKPELIVTVDNGIANHAGVIRAKSLGIQVLITDHHLPADTLPPADAIVNPNQPGCDFSSKNIAGVGVIFYVMLALRRHLLQNEWFKQQKIPEPNLSRLLDLVALGTVADVVSLDYNNRILVQQGLKRIRKNFCIPGISALLEIGNRSHARLVAADLGFVVAPRLNAAGRLDDMSLGIECLLTDDLEHARTLAAMLNQFNEERRVIEQDMQEQALHYLKKLEPTQEKLPRGICLFEEEWHQGVIGILASRIKDRFHRPVIAFALSNENELKGSARSIPGVHIRDALAHIATKHPDLIHKFGGHAMAAGLTLPRASFEKFSYEFDQIISTQLKAEDCHQSWLSDGELLDDEITLEIAEILREGGPWGQSFPEPLFDGTFRIFEQRLLAGKHLKMTLGKGDKILDAIAFNVDLTKWPNYRAEYVKMVYRLDINEFRGKCKLQFIVEHMEA